MWIGPWTALAVGFPEPIGLAATFDESLLHEVAGAISIEVRALHDRGRRTRRLGFIGTGLEPGRRTSTSSATRGGGADRRRTEKIRS